MVPGRIRAAAAAVGLHVPAKASSHSVSSSARAGDWRPNPCTDLERKEWLAILKAGPRRSKEISLLLAYLSPEARLMYRILQ